MHVTAHGSVQRDTGGPIHVLTSPRDKTVNTMPFAATKCFLNMLGKHSFVISDTPPTCPTCTKV